MPAGMHHSLWGSVNVYPDEPCKSTTYNFNGTKKAPVGASFEDWDSQFAEVAEEIKSAFWSLAIFSASETAFSKFHTR